MHPWPTDLSLQHPELMAQCQHLGAELAVTGTADDQDLDKDSHQVCCNPCNVSSMGLTVDSVRLGVFYVLVFLEIGSRRVIFCSATAHPDSAWVAQQARNVAWELDELKIPIKVLIHDRDAEYSSDFDTEFSAAGIRIARTPFRSPRPNAACGGYWAPCGESVWIG